MAAEILMGTGRNETIDVKRANISGAGSGANTVIAAVPGKRIRVLSMWYVVGAAVDVTFQDGAGGTALGGLGAYAAKGDGLVLPFNPLGWFETSVNTLFNMNLSGAVAVGGGIQYIEV